MAASLDGLASTARCLSTGLYAAANRSIERPRHACEDGSAINHRAIDHLPFAACPGMQDRAYHAKSEHHAPAPEIAHHIGGWRWLLVGAAISVKVARKRDIVDIVSSRLRIRALLPPTGHPAEDQARILLQQDIRTKAQALHHTRTKPLDKTIGVAAQTLND